LLRTFSPRSSQKAPQKIMSKMEIILVSRENQLSRRSPIVPCLLSMKIYLDLPQARGDS
jgi:hypothetical protein